MSLIKSSQFFTFYKTFNVLQITERKTRKQEETRTEDNKCQKKIETLTDKIQELEENLKLIKEEKKMFEQKKNEENESILEALSLKLENTENEKQMLLEQLQETKNERDTLRRMLFDEREKPILGLIHSLADKVIEHSVSDENIIRKLVFELKKRRATV